MSSTKSFINTFMLAIATLAITACVPKATEKKAVCGTNQAFSTVSRSCYSIEELRAKPVGTTATATILEETPQTITLNYTDGNKDKAISCKVSSISTSLEMVSPSFADGAVIDKAEEVYQQASNIATDLSLSETVMYNALVKARASTYYPTVVAQLTIFVAQANVLLNAGAVAAPGNVTIAYYYDLGVKRMADLTTLMTNMTNRCECTGGVCSTVAIPKLHKSGAAGFSYTVSDIDGEGTAKATAVTITPMSTSTAHLKPVAASSAVELNESTTSTATISAVTIPLAGDINSTSASSMRYYFNGTIIANQGITALGKVTGCMNLSGSDGLNDRTCLYTPNSGDTSDSTLLSADSLATASVGGLTFTAVAKGAAANNFTVQYFDLKSDNLSDDAYATTLQKFGLVSNDYEAYIRVVGNSIRIFIHPSVTTTAQIATLVNAHPQANKMVVASGGNATTPGASAAVNLAGGVDGDDKIPYYVNNTLTDSTNTSYVNIRMKSFDDVPFMNYVASAAKTVLEDVTPISIDLSSTYTDVDANHADVPMGVYSNTCNIDPLSTIFTNFTDGGCTCTALGVCTQVLIPDTNVSSTTAYTFNYRVSSVSNAGTLHSEYRLFYLTVTPINDAPELSTVALPTITAIGTRTVLEGGSDYIDVYVGPGGVGAAGAQYESSQQAGLTLTAVSDDQTLIPNANIVIGNTIPADIYKRRITYTPAANQSGSADITLTLVDTGSNTAPNVNTKDFTFPLDVTFVDNAPNFVTTITSIETNEGGAVQSDGFVVDEDLGSSPDENAQAVSITQITTDNHSVLPPSAIKIFYDLNDNGVEDDLEARAVGAMLESAAANDVKAHKFYLKLDPVDGISGNANVGLTISDGNSTSVTNFSFIVHPIAALHGGWTNISSVGLKTDKNGAPAAAAEIVCNYNKKTSDASNDTNRCSNASCLSTSTVTTPNGVVVPDAANVIYWDSSNLRCYRSTGTTAFSWVDMNTSCPITRKAGVCSGENCIRTSTPVGALVPSMVGQYVLDGTTNTCYVSTGTTNTNWIEYVPAKVTLAWKPFIMVGSGSESNVQTAGWNVYRRDAGTDYNLKGGHLKNSTSNVNFTITDPSIRTFTDTTAVAGRVYYYSVRPVDNARLFPTYTPESFSEVRVVAAPSNYSFVHRWMVNQEMCNGMNITTTTSPHHVDQTKNFRCEYTGPGSVLDTGVNYYDYGKDLLVDTQESGCAYAVAPNCTANGCVGIGAPTGYTANRNDLYYNRSTGACYINTSAVSGTTWSIFEAGALNSSIVSKTNSALNAPLTNLTRAKATATCNTRPAPVLSKTVLGVVTPFTPAVNIAQLPNKKDYMGYASQKLNVTDPEITEMEQGYSLNIQSRCNGSSASGLETAYTDSAIPSTSFIYSLPGTFSSGIRSLYTGSIPWVNNKGTEACVSRFGIQDLYGNVAEWVDDGMSCDPASYRSKVCTVDFGGTGSFIEDEFGNDRPYTFDNIIGPFNEGGDSIITYPSAELAVSIGIGTMSVVVDDSTVFPATGILVIGSEQMTYTANNGTTLTISARGVNSTTAVAHTAGDTVTIVRSDDSYLTNWTFGDQFFGASYFNYPLGMPYSSNFNQATFSAYLDWALSIGPSSGITTNKLHEDGIIVNGSEGAEKSFAVGGSYLSGNRAGRFSSELINNSVANRPDVGFRCIVPIDNTDYGVDSNHSYSY